MNAWVCGLALGALGFAQTSLGAVRHFLALKVSPNAQFVAYAVGNETDNVLWVQRLTGGPAVPLPGHVSWRFMANAPFGPKSDATELAWSPDGQRLAYVALDANARMRLWIWERRSGHASTAAGVLACGTAAGAAIPACNGNALQWSRNSRSVFFLGLRETSQRNDTAVAPEPSSSRAATAAGVSVRISPGVTVGASAAAESAADVFDFEVDKPEAHALTSCGQFSYLQISPNNSTLLAVADRAGYAWGPELPKQEYLDYFVIPLSHVDSPSAADGRSTCSGVTNQGGEPLVPIVSGVRQRYPLVSWSADGNRFAYIEHGATSDGDVMVYELASGTLVNATAHFQDPAIAAKMAALSKDAVYPGTKFGSSIAPIWSSDGKALWVLRREPREQGWRTGLWSVDLSARTATEFYGPGDCDLLAAHGSDKGAHALAYCDGGQMRTLSISRRGETRMRCELGELAPSLISFARGGKVGFVGQSQARPQEIYILGDNGCSPAQLTHVNAGLEPEALRWSNVLWKGMSGETLWGLLLQRNQNDGSASPLIVQVYPHEPIYNGIPRLNFIQSADYLLQPLRDLIGQGFSVFIPRLTVSGHGDTCADLVADLSNGLQAIEQRHLALVSNAGIIGHSFGGWTVNCIVARSRSFKAAVAMSGMSDLISLNFSDGNRQLGWSGGQTNIGETLISAPLRYWQESPLSQVANAQTPLLLLHGRKDLTVPYEQSVEMFNALADRGKDAKLVLYDDAGHGDILNRPDVAADVREWFLEHLK